MAAQFHAMLITILRLCAWLATLVVIFVPLEHLFAIRPKKILRKGIGSDLGYFFISRLVPIAVLALQSVRWPGLSTMPFRMISWIHRILAALAQSMSP